MVRNQSGALCIARPVVFVDVSEYSARTPEQARRLSAAIAKAAEMIEGTFVLKPLPRGTGRWISTTLALPSSSKRLSDLGRRLGAAVL